MLVLARRPHSAAVVARGRGPTADFGIFTCFTILTGAFLDIVIDPILLGLLAPRGD
jgi:hypothetical protein